MIDDPRAQAHDGTDPTTDPVAGSDPALTELLGTVGDRLRQAPDELTTRRHLAAIRAEQAAERSLGHISAATPGRRRRRRDVAGTGGRRRTGLAVGLTSGVAATAVALALVGMLPGPVQRLAAETVARVGIELPGAGRPAGSPTDLTKMLETPVPAPGSETGAPEDALRPAPPVTTPDRPATPFPYETRPPTHEFRPEFDRPSPWLVPTPSEPPRTGGPSDEARPDRRGTDRNDPPPPTPPRDAGTSVPAPGRATSPAPGERAHNERAEDERAEDERDAQDPIPPSNATDDATPTTPGPVPPVDAPGDDDEAGDPAVTAPSLSVDQ